MSKVEPQSPVRLLIVDDSALMRKLLADLLRSAPEIEVVGAARNGAEALELAAALSPDVITLDVEMPGMSGLEVLPLLLKARPVPVVMVSSLTQEGAEVTLEALDLGAVDFLPKPDRLQVAQFKSAGPQLVAKVLSAAKSRVRPSQGAVAPAPAPPPSSTRIISPSSPPRSAASTSQSRDARSCQCILIGISTGGPQALGQVLPLFAPPTPPILIVQHMPANFTQVFAQRLNRQCALSVKEAEHNDIAAPNSILVAPGGRHMTLCGTPKSPRVSLSDGPLVSGHKPSVDMLFQSGARLYGPNAAAIIMTGMGRDGVDGCHKVLELGGITFGQDEATSVVYGMNKVAHREGAVRNQFALQDLPDLIRKLSQGT